MFGNQTLLCQVVLPVRSCAAAIRPDRERAWWRGQRAASRGSAAKDRCPGELVVAATTTPAALVAKTATSAIPIVFTIGADPIAIGLVDSLSRPKGNATGVNQYLSDLGAKRLELLRDLLPNVAGIAVLVNPNFPDAASQSKDAQEAARMLGQKIHVVNASSEADFDGVFATLVQLKAGALIVTVDPVFNSRRDQLVTLAARHKIPAIYFGREFVVAGGLMSYAADLGDGYRQAGIYVGRILKGAKPAEMPIEQSPRFFMAVNLKAAALLCRMCSSPAPTR